MLCRGLSCGAVGLGCRAGWAVRLGGWGRRVPSALRRRPAHHRCRLCRCRRRRGGRTTRTRSSPRRGAPSGTACFLAGSGCRSLMAVALGELGCWVAPHHFVLHFALLLHACSLHSATCSISSISLTLQCSTYQQGNRRGLRVICQWAVNKVAADAQGLLGCTMPGKHGHSLSAQAQCALHMMGTPSWRHVSRPSHSAATQAG